MQLFPLFYFPPISWFAAFMRADEVALEQYEYFPKQTFRNRMKILGANRALTLSIPLCHPGKRTIKEVEISYAENWQAQHWKSIQSAYQSSPYFEFYQQRLQKVFEHKAVFLIEYNLMILDLMLELLKLNKTYCLTSEYQQDPKGIDYRTSFSAKKENTLVFREYYQVFSEKLGFQKDLSILDVLCNLGPETKNYLNKINIDV